MKKFLEDLIAKKEQRMTELKTQIEKSESLEEVRSLGKEKEAVEGEIAELRTQLQKVEQNGVLDPMATFGQNGQKRDKNVDPTDTEEYRTAFMNFVCRGTAFPAELRVDAITKTSDASVVIPTTMLNEIIQKLDTYGDIYSKVRKLNVQGGVEIPILSLKPTATWISADTGTSESDKQKLQMNTKITFSYFGLECKIAQTLLVNVTTLSMFQNLFVQLATEAIVRAMEKAIIAGTGSGQPTGITVDSRVPSANVITLTPSEFGDWSTWKKKVFAKMKKAYRQGEFVMAQGTFDGYIDGMVDKNGQPIGRVNYGIEGGETYRFGGKNVMTVEDELIADFETATKGTVVAVFVNWSDYAINSNMELQVVKWIDHDTNEVKNKAILIADGKLVDPNGVLIIKKGEESA